ncbi:hypothetical protein Nepgr_000099 [Nepenthes gracilis]|uniref:DUF4378 domain-containing protein n=1 Tax=Nepenthes gracilis TaxID=150966 RepID=A0AAD3P1H8_NEPGR|nr:hypothetical protein Nepgr_000099 [Nepenthes gracilis]
MQSCHEKEQEPEIAVTGDFEARKNTGSAPEICSQSTEMDSNEFPFSEGSHPKTSVPQFDYSDIEINLHSSNIADSESTGSSCIEVVNNLNILDDPWHSGHIIERDEKYDAEFKYVKFVLELSGLTREGQLETQHLLEQPLDAALFEEAEAGCPLELKLSMGEVASSNCQRNLLFGLVDEAMLSIFERSSAYYPKTLSFSCQIHPVPTGNRVLEEVWAFVSRRLRWNLEQGLQLDGAVAQDLSKNDGWMNLQFESECIALQLEHLIFNELLEEIICFT